MDEPTREILGRIADERSLSHCGHASTRRLSPAYDRLGVAGEWAFAQAFNLPFLSARRQIGGDGGVDNWLPLLFRVDVKTFERPFHLLVEQGKVEADIYVLAGYYGDILDAKLLGWEWASNLLRTPVRDFGKGILNHHIHRDELRPMAELHRRRAIIGLDVTDTNDRHDPWTPAQEVAP